MSFETNGTPYSDLVRINYFLKIGTGRLHLEDAYFYVTPCILRIDLVMRRDLTTFDLGVQDTVFVPV